MHDTDRLTAALSDRYRIERELGQGGMATVYLAEDLKHRRKVAIKVLRPELAAVLGVERFLQEIELTANLQHPHILTLYDSGQVEQQLFYVMPYIEGESLADRLARERQLSVEESVRITCEVADALDYAHRHGVVHRDIKPANVLLQDGRAMVADFGIARAVRAAGADRLTGTGLSLGTPGYMSPEQAAGDREIDGRSDQFSLACMTYEMLVGEPPHAGPTIQAIIARLLAERPKPVTAVRPSVPAHVEAAILRALEKLPADRFATAAAFGEALVHPAATAARTLLAPAAKREPRWRRVALAAAGVALAAVGVALWGWLRPAPPRPVIRYNLGLPAEQGMQQGVLGVNLALSPDGRRLVYLGQGDRLWLRERDRLDATPLPGTDGPINPVFSPDGGQIAFSAGPTYILKVVAVEGGPPVTLAVANLGGGIAWSEDGWIYFDSPGGLSRVRASGGESQVVVPLDTAHGEQGQAWADVLPGGKRVLLRSRRSFDPEDFDIVVADLASGVRHVLTKGLLARYVAPGYLVYVRADGALVAARFRPGDNALRGTATPLLEGIMTKPPWGSVDLALSREGTLVYVPGSAARGAAGEVVWASGDGAASSLQPTLAVNPGPNHGLALSPDGTRLALDAIGPRSTDIWVKQLPSGSFSRLTFDGSVNTRPSWSSDGRSIVFVSNRGGQAMELWWQRADGSTPAERLLRVRAPVWEGHLSRDSRWLIYRVSADSGDDVYGLRLGQDTTPVPLLTSRFNEQAPALSADGQWLAYASDESGRPEVYVRPFPRTSEGRWQVSTSGGGAPRWAHSGRELFYESATGDLMVAPVTTRPTFSAGTPRRLLGGIGSQYWGSGSVPYWDVSPDDRRFLMVRTAGVSQASGAGRLIVVENWVQELRAKVAAGQR